MIIRFERETDKYNTYKREREREREREGEGGREKGKGRGMMDDTEVFLRVVVVCEVVEPVVDIVALSCLVVDSEYKNMI